MDNLDDEFDLSPTPVAKRNPLSIVAGLAASAKRSPLSIVAGLTAAGAAVLLLWMNFGLSSRVSTVEESIITLQKSVSEQNQSKELAGITRQLDSVIQAFTNHLKLHAIKRIESQESLSMQPSNPASPLPSRAIPSQSSIAPDLSIQPIAKPRASKDSADRSHNKGSLPPPISKVDIAPTQNPSGISWVINITSVSDSKSALQEIARLRKMDINAEISRAVSNGKVWYRIQVPGFASHDEANDARPSLEKRLGISDTWVGQNE